MRSRLNYLTVFRVPRQPLGNVVISGAVSPDDFTQPLVDSPFTRQILNSPSTTWECEISLCATTSKHYPAVVWRSCQLRIEKRIAVSIAKIVEPGCSPGEFAPLYSHSLPHRPLSVLWKCSDDYPELFDAPPNCQYGLVARVCSRLQLLLPINLVDPVTGICWVPGRQTCRCNRSQLI